MNSRWVDRYATSGKRAGAYCWSSYRSNPYISTDFQQRLTLSDVYTLTHELGHAGHNLYAREQPFQDWRYPSVLAEVTSNVHEVLLTEHLLQTARSRPEMQAYLIDQQIQQVFIRSLFLQTTHAEFEQITHEIAQEGGARTLKRYSEEYLGLRAKYYGPHFVTDDELGVYPLRYQHFRDAFGQVTSAER